MIRIVNVAIWNKRFCFYSNATRYRLDVGKDQYKPTTRLRTPKFNSQGLNAVIAMIRVSPHHHWTHFVPPFMIGLNGRDVTKFHYESTDCFRACAVTAMLALIEKLHLAE